MFMTRPQPNRAFRWTQAPWGDVLCCTPLAASAQHFFTIRNLTLRGRPQEWSAVAAAAGVDADNLLLVHQVHQADVAVASDDRPRPWPQPRADAIVSDDPAVAVAVRVADCVPILLADERGQAVAAVHAGWRGTARRAAIAGVEALQVHYGVRPERLLAAVGPSIGPCCYDVGEATRTAFREAGHHVDLLDRWFASRGAGKFSLDLWRATREQLEGAGLLPGNIHIAELCTKTHAAHFHSYRVDGAGAGRMLGLIRAANGKG
jgi:polyphenol oxidase